MKRKLEESDDGFFEKPTKMLPPAAGNYCYQDYGSPPGHYGQPILASTPDGVSVGGGGHRPLVTMPRNPARNFQSNAAADNELRHVIDNFVSVYEQLDKGDDPDVKPNYSYSELAYIAMLRSPNFCLPIGQIYSYIQNRFKFFRNSTRKHWKNAVRHSLAKTMCFSKIPVGRGASSNERLARSTYLWCILPSSIACFARGDYRATIDRETGTNTLRSAYFRMNSEPFWNAVGDYIANKMAHFRKTLEESNIPGHIFESQTCSLPMKQEKIQHGIRPSLQREVFQEVQNQPRIPVNNGIQLRNCGTTAPVSPPLYYIVQSNEMVLPAQAQPSHPSAQAQSSHPSAEAQLLHTSAKAQSSPHLQAYHAQTRSSSPVLHVHEHQSRNQSTFDRSSSTPREEDPWLPGITISSPEPSLIYPNSGRGTPLCSSFDNTDSGYFNSSTNDSSCSFINSCNKQTHDRYLKLSPVNNAGHYNADSRSNSNEYEFNQFDLSPFSLSDFSDLNENNGQRKFPLDKIHGSPMISPTSHCFGQPTFISTPVHNQKRSSDIQCFRQPLIDPPSPPTQCRYIYQQPLQVQHETGRRTPASPIMFNGDVMISTPILPHWASYC